MNSGLALPISQPRRALALIAAAAIMLTALLGTAPAARAVTTLASDAFGRVVANGWGNLDVGGPWLITDGNDPLTDVNGSIGRMNHITAGEMKARATSFNANDVDISAKFRAETASNNSSNSTTEFALYARYDPEPNFRYYLKLVLSFVVGRPSPVLRVDQQAVTFTGGIATHGLSPLNNDPTAEWMMRFQTVGTHVRAKAWPALQSEPAAWQIDITNTKVPGSGQTASQFAVGTFTDDVTPAMVIDVDDVNVTAVAEATPPTIIAKSPLPNATGVGLSPTVTAKFSEPVTGVGTGTFVLSNVVDLVKIPATVSYDAGTHIASLHPSSPLQQGASYRVALSGSIKDLSGNSLPWTTWTFTTLVTTTNYSPAAAVTVKLGTHTGYKFSSTGAVTATKTFTLASNSGTTATQRRGITNQSGGWLAINAGVWAGYWVRESSVFYLTASPISVPPGSNATFSPAKSLSFKKGTHTGYKFSAGGVMTAQKTFTLASNSSAKTTARTTITNQSGKWFLVSSGVWAGYYVRSSDVIYLTP